MRRRRSEWLLRGVCLLALLIPCAALVLLVGGALVEGSGHLGVDFLVRGDSRHPERAGALPAIAGTLWLMVLTAVMAVPFGVGAAIWLEEYAPRGRFGRWVDLNVATLAGVPSVLYGVLALEVFVRVAGFGRGVFTGACTLAVLVLPLVVMASREAIRAVPDELREAALGLGASRWETVRQVVLPMAMPGVLTGAILAISRAIGEAAPLLVVGAAAWVSFVPDGLGSPYTALPIQIFGWLNSRDPAFFAHASAGVVVLMVMLVLLNGAAIWQRQRMEGGQR